MLDNIPLSNLQALLDTKFGKKAWIKWEPETILFELNEASVLLMDKIYVLQCLNHNVNEVMSIPEFVLWTTSVTNNEQAQFETVNIPTSLELAWMVEQVKVVALLSGQKFEPSQELGTIIGYLLKLEGYSEVVKPFEFVPTSILEAGQTKEDTSMKQTAIVQYLSHMRENSHV
jgi:hypothetical protein